MGQKYTIAWKSTLLASTKEGYANKFQLLCATKHLKVEFHSGEAENGKHKVDHSHKSLVIVFVQQKSLYFQTVAVLKNIKTCLELAYQVASLNARHENVDKSIVLPHKMGVK